MNFGEMVSWCFSALGDPGESESAIFGEVARCLSAGETRVSNMLPNTERENFAATYTVPAVSGTQEYVMPTDFLDIISVKWDGYFATRISLKQRPSNTRNTLYRPNKVRSLFFYQTGSTQGRTKIGLDPTPNNTANIIVTYFRKPIGFHDQGSAPGVVTLANNRTGNGAVTAATSSITTVFHDNNIPFAAAETATSAVADTGVTPAGYGQTAFWTNAEVRFKTGANAGQKRPVTTFKDFVVPGAADGITPVSTVGATQSSSYGRFIFAAADAWYNAPAVGDEYEANQVSILPDNYHDLVCLWACFLLAPKAKADAKFFADAFMQSAMQMGLKHTQNVEAVMVGETPGGAR